jgi:hypothetical protein
MPVKYLEIISNIIYEQNRQLLQEISNDLDLPLDELYSDFLTSKQQFYCFFNKSKA